MWNSTLTVLALPIVIATSLLGCGDDGTDSQDTLVGILLDMDAEYTSVVEQAVPDVLCNRVDPATQNAECAEFMDVIASVNPGIDRAIERFVRLVQQRYEGQDGAELLSEGLDALRAEDQADEMLVEAWQAEDLARWQDAWVLQAQAVEMWTNFRNAVFEAAQDSGTPIDDVPSPSATDVAGHVG